MTIRLGYQIPNFSYGSSVAELFPTVIAQAREAESAEIAEQIRRRILDHGADGLVINIPINGHEPGIVELAGKALRPLVS